MSYKHHFIGERVMVVSDTFGPDEKVETDHGFIHRRPALPGTVTYISEAKGWYQVTFDIGVKACFFFEEE